uniref:phosphatidylinositol 3-kinase n=1 Tax=Paramoeba aestuarina TaxID=180227 RepID=A0A7S4JS38_9EUKA|mmetsp:Transcript_12659/g.19405  ORF Transcript_12659/g.19405 Transcript_12659/m.19405 type:complete len:907 (+) Transcript_12659:213-2933(+)
MKKEKGKKKKRKRKEIEIEMANRPKFPEGSRQTARQGSTTSTHTAQLTSSNQPQKYEFLLTSDINLNVRMKISHLEGALLREDVCAENFFIESYLHAEGRPLCLPIRTSHNSFCSDSRCWEQWIVFPVVYSHLPLDTHLVISIFGNSTVLREVVPVGGTSFPLFKESHTLHRGRHKLVVWLDREGDCGVPSETPGEPAPGDMEELYRLEKAAKWYDQQLLDRVSWLDPLTLETVDIMKKEIMEEQIGRLFLHIELPSFAKPVLYHEVLWLFPPQVGGQQPDVSLPLVSDLETLTKMGIDGKSQNIKVPVVRDYEIGLENPVDTQHMKLSRSFRRGVFDKNLIPNARERKQIQSLIRSPSTKILNQKEKDFVWKFRYFLKDNRKALSKFLKCVDWTDMQQRKQANELIAKWEPMDASDALELLDISFGGVQEVREYAISRLRTSGDDELRSYLFALVASLRYEQEGNLLGTFLVEKALQNEKFANDFYWFLFAECQSQHRYRSLYQNQIQELKCALVTTQIGSKQLNIIERQELLLDSIRKLQQDLLAMGIKDRKKRIEKMVEILQNPLNREYAGLGEKNLSGLPLPLKPEVKVGKVIPDGSYIFKSAMQPLRVTFSIHSESVENWRSSMGIEEEESGGKGEVENKVKNFPVIFKTGDDLRQDQLIIQMIGLMDMLLCKENLDLRLTPYNILANSFVDGMVECVPNSHSVASILEDGDIRKFLMTHNPAPSSSSSKEEIDPYAMDTFLRSCAGYCVITYILGIGDRHLDNLLMTKRGHLFHIDFGYILGMDPKPFPPPMKLCKEMVEAMGGANSKSYTKFKEHCCEAYIILRKSSNLILNLISMALHAGIVKLDAEKSILKVQEKFRLELTDEEASQAFQSLIKMSVSALFPQLLEPLHRWAQYWRS